MWIDGEGRQVSWGSIIGSTAKGVVPVAIAAGLLAWYILAYQLDAIVAFARQAIG